MAQIETPARAGFGGVDISSPEEAERAAAICCGAIERHIGVLAGRTSTLTPGDVSAMPMLAPISTR